jgi:Tfp pilus assembly protein PilN
LDAIQTTVQKLRGEVLDKDREIENLKKTIEDIQKMQENKRAVYLNGSNLGNKL